jgi:flagellar basal body P-ring protein FlgI
MTRTQALITLMAEARKEKGSNTACQRTVRALRALGLAPMEIIEILAWLDYCHGVTGVPWRPNIKRTW